MDDSKRDTTSFRRLISAFKSPTASASSSSSISSPSPSSVPSFKPFTVPLPNPRWKRQQAQSTRPRYNVNTRDIAATAVSSQLFSRRPRQETRPLGISIVPELGLDDQNQDLPLDAFGLQSLLPPLHLLSMLLFNTYVLRR